MSAHWNLSIKRYFKLFSSTLTINRRALLENTNQIPAPSPALITALSAHTPQVDPPPALAALLDIINLFPPQVAVQLAPRGRLNLQAAHLAVSHALPVLTRTRGPLHVLAATRGHISHLPVQGTVFHAIPELISRPQDQPGAPFVWREVTHL